MKKTVFILILLIFSFMMTAQPPAAKTEEKAGKKAEAGPVIKDVEGFWYVYKDYKGPYTKMEQEVQKFVNEFMGQGLMPLQPAVSMYYNSPANTKPEDLKWAFGFMVPKDTKVKEPLMIKEIKACKAVVYLHKGAYKNLAESHEILNAFIKKKGLAEAFPVYDKYLNNAMMVKEEELKTELIRPLKQK